MFFTLNKRDIYITTMAMFLKQTLDTGQKIWIGYNTG